MSRDEPRQTYTDHFAALRQELGAEEAVRAAIGGEFAAVGLLEYYLLLSLGLAKDHYVVDVGCGSGRLASRLATIAGLRYLGIDIVKELVNSARELAKRPDWSFRVTEGTNIPGEDGSADFVCFFSVLTHLSHEDSFRYLAEAKRMLKPGGKIVFSFLEFRIPCHWAVFENSLKHATRDLHLNQFLDREAIMVWAQKLGLEIEIMADGDRPHIPIAGKIIWEDGRVMEERGNLGQSVAVLRVPRTRETKLEVTQLTAQGEHAMDLSNGRFVCVSTRGWVGAGNEVLIVGFVIRSGEKRVLIRAIGPGLAPFDIPNFVTKPKIEVINADGRSLASNAGFYTEGMEQRIQVMEATKALNAQIVTDNDAALVALLPAGVYSVVVRNQDEKPGIVLAEVFEVPMVLGQPKQAG